MSEEQRGNVEVAAPDGVMQGCVRLVVFTAGTGPSTGPKEKLNSLEAVAPPDKAGASHGQLQWEFAAPLQTRATGIGFSIILEKQAHCTEVGLPHGLMQRMFL